MVLRHKRIFGVNCSPFLLAAVIRFHLSNIGPEDQRIAERLLKSMYVNNTQTSINSVAELRRFKDDASRMMAEAKMELRQWIWTAEESISEGILMTGMDDLDLSTESYKGKGDHTTPMLGMMWDRQEDRLWTDWRNQGPLIVITKCTIWSVVNQVFDPIRFLCLVLLRPKKILQQAWLTKRSWDEALEEESISEFKAWYEELACLSTIRIPQDITRGNICQENWQLHVFSDASQDAYAAVVYLRTQETCDVSVQLLQARARITPIKKVSFPRLELFGYVIAVRLAVSVKVSLKLEGVPTF